MLLLGLLPPAPPAAAASLVDAVGKPVPAFITRRFAERSGFCKMFVGWPLYIIGGAHRRALVIPGSAAGLGEDESDGPDVDRSSGKRPAEKPPGNRNRRGELPDRPP